jgi:hypothetical protein
MPFLEPVVEISDPSTWPSDALERASAKARTIQGRGPFYIEDLRWRGFDPEESEDAVRSLFAGRRIQAYHFTRLLDYEATSIRAKGLRPLTIDLVRERLDGAEAAGLLTRSRRDDLLATNVFARGQGPLRERQVWLTLGRGVCDEPAAVVDLLSRWGGEAVYKLASADGSRDHQLGKPAIVVAELDLAVSVQAARTYPEFPQLLVGMLLETEGSRHADVQWRSPDGIATSRIADIWQPGDANYDRHTGLPRS